MKILYLVNTLDISSGWGRFSLELIERFIQRGIDATIFSEKGSSYRNEKVVLKRSIKALSSIPYVRSCIKKEKFDIIHSFEVNPYGIIANLANTGLKTKEIITATGAYSVRPLHRTSTRFLTKRAYRQADAVLCISKYIEDEINEQVNLSNTSVITLGVDQSKFVGERFIPDRPFILSVGNYSPRKGYEVSIPAFAKIAACFPEVIYYIAGKFEESTLLHFKKMIEGYHLSGRIVFLGSVGDEKLRSLYSSAELFILTSVNIDHHFEGFGLVFLEAAAAGLPVIGTLNNGIADAMLDGKNGFLVKQFDIGATAGAIASILQNRNLQSDFSHQSKKWAAQNTWDSVVDKYLQVYNQV